MQILINPRLGLGNNPDIEITGLKMPVRDKNKEIWHVKDGMYWYQNADGTITDFLAHGGKLSPVQTDGKRHSEKDAGFGGYAFEFKCSINNEIYDVVLHGPWSSGCYGANQYLPIPCTEIYCKDNYACRNYPIEIINKYLKERGSKWEVRYGIMPIYDVEGSKPCRWVECFYDGVRKQHWDKATLNMLHDMYTEQRVAL